MTNRRGSGNDQSFFPSGRIQELVRLLAETEEELQSLTAGQVDAVLDPSRGTPILLRQAQEALCRAHAELEGRVRERTTDLARANDALRAEMAERERTEAALELYAGRLKIMSRMDRAILAAHTQEEIANIAVGHLRWLLECRRASVALFDLQAGETYVAAVQVDDESHVENGWRGPLPSPVVLQVLQSGQPYIIDDMAVHPARHPNIPLLKAEGIGSCIVAPLLAGENLFGSLTVGMAEPGPWPADLVEIVREVAVQLAVGIQQARLSGALARHAEHLEQEVTRRIAQLQASEASSRTLFEAAGVGMAVVDADGCLRKSNLMLQSMLGYTGEELQGMSYARFMLPEHMRAQEAAYRRLFAGELDEVPFCREIRYLPRNGQLRWGQVTVSLVRADEGPPEFCIVALQDTTEQKQTMEALIHAEKLAVTGRLTALLAHEINNPLQSVVGCLGLAEKALAQGKGAESYVGVARKEVRRVAQIVAQLRDVNRNSKDEEHEPAAVNTLVANALAQVAGQCESRNIRVSWEPAPGLPLLSLAANRIQQVFLNLALNAIEAMPTGGRLQVGSRYTREPAGVEVSLTDTGLGIDAGALARPFEPFATDKPLGRGLGLYISNRIVEEHGGRIDIDTRAGRGTTFHVWLPAP